MADHPIPDDLVARLREGCVLLPKRWSGDIGSDRPYGLLDEEATDRLMSEAADRIEQLEAERDICAEKHCERPTDYGATYNVGGVRVEMYLCEEHFDALGERVSDDNRVAERDQWESQNEQLGYQLMDIAAERDTLAEIVRLLDVSTEPYAEGETVWWLITDDWFDHALTPDQAERFQQVLDRITKEAETSD